MHRVYRMVLIKIGLRFLGSMLILTLVACGSPDQEQTNARHLERATAYEDQGQYKAAIIEYRNAVKKSKGGVVAILQYAQMLNDLGHYSSALNLLEQSEGKKSEAYYLVLVETFSHFTVY